MTEITELFAPDVVASESPRLRWMREHDITVHSPPADMVGMEDDYGDPIYAYYAERRSQGAYDKAKIGMGATLDDALHDFAIKWGIRLWNEALPTPP